MTRIANYKMSLRNFHQDERGLEALQVVMIIAIAAVCLIVVKNFWNPVREWFNSMMKGATGEEGDKWDTSK